MKLPFGFFNECDTLVFFTFEFLFLWILNIFVCSKISSLPVSPQTSLKKPAKPCLLTANLPYLCIHSTFNRIICFVYSYLCLPLPFFLSSVPSFKYEQFKSMNYYASQNVTYAYIISYWCFSQIWPFSQFSKTTLFQLFPHHISNSSSLLFFQYP